MTVFLNLPAPAKLNLFLHVVGRKPDGMHLLESVFALIDLCDYIDLELTKDARIQREGDIDWALKDDLCYRAAKLLQGYAPNKGCRIRVKKNIPHGAGLGGGSSDAATCLIGLNRLWNLNLSRRELVMLGCQLGADVPFFIFGRNAFARGVGEKLIPIKLHAFKALVVFPGVSIPTKEIFSDPHLTRDSKPFIMQDFSELMKSFPKFQIGKNDLEPVTRRISSEVEEACRLVNSYGEARMTGSGSAVFSAVELSSKVNPLDHLPSGWSQWSVQSLEVHPLNGWFEL